MTLGERIIDLYYREYLEPFVLTALKVTMKTGFTSRPMSPEKERKFHRHNPEFKIIMKMPGLALRIIVADFGSFHPYVHKDNVDVTELIYILELLNGLAIWRRHCVGSYLARSVVPDLGSVKPQHFNDWVRWGGQKGYIDEDSIV